MRSQSQLKVDVDLINCKVQPRPQTKTRTIRVIYFTILSKKKGHIRLIHDFFPCPVCIHVSLTRKVSMYYIYI